MMDIVEMLIVGAIVVLLGICGLAGYGAMLERNAFMTDCQKERKTYECTAMWRAGESHYVPIVIPVR